MLEELRSIFAELLPVAVAGIPFALALVLGLAIPVAIVAMSALAGKYSESTRLSAMLCTLIVGTTLPVAMSGRVLYSVLEQDLNPQLGSGEQSSIYGTLASQAASALVLCLACAEIVRWITGKGRMNTRVRTLWLVAMAYYVASVAMSGLFGTFRNPNLKDLYGPVMMTGLALLAGGGDENFWRRLRIGLLLPIVGSLAAMLLSPTLSLLPGYATLIPGFGYRLYGIADHANALGMVAVAALVIELSPAVRSRPSVVLIACQLTVLLLSQSKTAWLAALVCAFFVRFAWLKHRLFGLDKWRATLALGAISSFAVALTVVAVAVRMDKVLQALVDTGVDTFTGRTRIWQLTLDEFYKSPLFGYGPSLWDMQFRTDAHMLYVGQAHNQFVQTLGQAGLIGLLSLVIYLIVLAHAAVNGRHRDRGLAMSFVLLILIRCFSESPLRMIGAMGWDNWIHFTTFVAAAALAHGMERAAPRGVDPSKNLVGRQGT